MPTFNFNLKSLSKAIGVGNILLENSVAVESVDSDFTFVPEDFEMGICPVEYRSELATLLAAEGNYALAWERFGFEIDDLRWGVKALEMTFTGFLNALYSQWGEVPNVTVSFHNSPTYSLFSWVGGSLPRNPTFEKHDSTRWADFEEEDWSVAFFARRSK